MARTKIEWTDTTWNPVTGCSKVSEGCRHCYAERMARRLQAMGQPNYARGFEIACHPHMLTTPLRWRSPQMVFVNSMGDLFHEKVPDEFILRVFETMRQAHWHTFQVLTKRSERLQALGQLISWPENVWAGVTVENRACADRVDHLSRVPAAVRFLSLEPLIGSVGSLDLRGIDWVIVGGESGPGARPMREEWALDLRDQCQRADVPFFFKQWGGVRRTLNGRILEGRTYDGMPVTASAGTKQLRVSAS